MKTISLYILAVILSVFSIAGIIQYGKRLSAPPALPDHWISQVPIPDASCKLLEAKSYRLALKQSGENLSLFWADAPHWELHGKIDRSGQFRLRGKLSGRKREGCSRAELIWLGAADGQSMSGRLSIVSDSCPLCPNGLVFKAEEKHD